MVSRLLTSTCSQLQRHLHYLCWPASLVALSLAGSVSCGVSEGVGTDADAQTRCAGPSALKRAGLARYLEAARARQQVGLEVEFYTNDLNTVRGLLEELETERLEELAFSGYWVERDRRRFSARVDSNLGMAAETDVQSMHPSHATWQVRLGPQTIPFNNSCEMKRYAERFADVDYDAPSHFHADLRLHCKLDFPCRLTLNTSPGETPNRMRLSVGGHAEVLPLSESGAENLLSSATPVEFLAEVDARGTPSAFALAMPRPWQASLHRVRELGKVLLLSAESTADEVGELSLAKGHFSGGYLKWLEQLWSTLSRSYDLRESRDRKPPQGLHINLDVLPFAHDIAAIELQQEPVHPNQPRASAAAIALEFLAVWNELRESHILPLFSPDPSRQLYYGGLPDDLIKRLQNTEGLDIDDVNARILEWTAAEEVRLNLPDGIGNDVRLNKVNKYGRIEVTLADSDINANFLIVKEQVEFVMAAYEKALQNLGL